MPKKIKKEYTRDKRSGYSPRRFSAVMGTAATLATVSLITFFSIGMVGAAMGVGIGGFVANFGKVNATEGAEVFPVVGQQPACEDAPQLQATLNGTAKLSDGVEFFKDMPLPSPSNFNNDDFARITIVGQDNGTPIQVSDLSLRLSALETDELGLGGAEIVEYGPEDYDSGNGTPGAEGSYVDTTDNATGGIQTEGPSAAFDDGRSALDTDTGPSSTPEFGIDATSFLINNGSAAAHFVSFGGISLSDVNIAVQILNESEDGSNGPATRVVRPDERTCDALAEASSVNDSDNINESSGGIDL